ncbi:MAG: NAD(P)H-dependent oxidoreductase [Ilumatobacteraceae bacterium]
MRTYVVFCHPRRDSFCGAAYDRVLAGLATGGHEVRTCDLYADGFEPALSLADRQAHLVDHRTDPGRRPDITSYVTDLAWCEMLVLVYPTWWSGQPAMLKGWFDRVLVQGVAWELPSGANRLQPLLRNVRRIVAVTTHGSPKLTNALQGETGKHTVTRAIRVLCSRRCRTTWLPCYGVDRLDAESRAQFLERVERKIARL